MSRLNSRVKKLEEMINPAPGFLIFCGNAKERPEEKMERYFKEHPEFDPGSTMIILLTDAFAK